ncbi:MAG: ATP-binding cassette domain-containing protein [Clostridiales bacterium]|nr:ATP-binding cassette domain-containing protein [Clostridiales bacterium]
MLQLKDICKVYGDGENKVIALDNLSVEFADSGLTSILGPSGCGKTTLLNIIGGLDKYTSGELIINGVSTKQYKNADWDTYRNNNIGFVFQTYYLIPHLNILENVMLAMDLSGLSHKEQKRRALEALDKVGVKDQAKKKPKQLSGGQAQRVAIARALVNNPDIILADEPTGALDSENSVQILALLKEISKKSLVILVTHNQELAEQYSDRIIKIKDGKILSDEHIYPENSIYKNQEKISGKKIKKPTMKMLSAFKMSIKNLYYKLGRTAITAIAGCIGVVSIAIILAFNAGFSAYAKSFERDSLYKYPITVSKSDSKLVEIMTKIAKGDDIDTSVIDMDQILDMLKDPEEDKKAYTDEQKIFMQEQISAMMRNTNNLLKSNDTKLLKEYIDQNFDHSLATVKYDYNLNLNVFRTDYKDDNLTGYTKLNPYSDRMISSFDSLMSILGGKGSNALSDKDLEDIITVMNSINIWDMMVNDNEVLKSQYDVIAGALPNDQVKDGVYEIALVVDKYNQITDNMLYALGYIELMSMFGDIISEFLNLDIKTPMPEEYSFKDFLGKEFKLVLEKDFYKFNAQSNLYELITDKAESVNNITDNAVTLRIAGILRPKENVSNGSINGVIGYTERLAKYVINQTNQSDIVKAQRLDYEKYKEKTTNEEVVALQNALKKGEMKEEDLTFQQKMLLASAMTAQITSVITGEKLEEAEYHRMLKRLGAEDVNSPESIYFYPKSVAAKEDVVSFIEKYNDKMRELYDLGQASDDNSVEYVNELDDIMNSLNGMINTITYILVAITCLAVIVSLFMVGIIMYISVQDRTKEIGILRSMGARNLDILNIFNTETLCLGFISGGIGVAFSYILKYPINALLKAYLGISNLITPIWWNSLLLIAASVILTLISGAIPAIVASKKDPVVALKAE